jgi:hypothetical protein
MKVLAEEEVMMEVVDTSTEREVLNFDFGLR